MKGKPIEPGCLAMVAPGGTFPDNDGLVVRVLYWMEAGTGDPVTRLRMVTDGWMVQTMSRPLVVKTIEGNTFLVQRRGYTPRRLIRIDGGEEPEQVKEKKEVPKKEDVY